MKNVIIDTNALISFVTDRNPSQQKRITKLFEEVVRLKLSIICHQNVIAEFVYVLDNVYGIKKEKISEIIFDFLNMPGVILAAELDYKTVLELWPKSVPDYGDALIAALCKRTQNASIATFDARFKKALSKLSIAVHKF